MTLGERIKSLRKAKDITQRELAKKIDVDYTYISKIENDRLGKGEGPGEKVIRKIAYVLVDKNQDSVYNELMLLANKISEDLKNKLLANKKELMNVFYRKTTEQKPSLYKYLRKIIEK